MAFSDTRLAEEQAESDTVSQQSSAFGHRLIVKDSILTNMHQIADDNIRTVSQPKSPAANKALLTRHLGTFQFLMLAVFFVVPLILGIYVPLFPQENLNEILAFEFGVLIYGFYLAGFLYLPVALTKSVWARRICLLLACLLAVPLTSGYWSEYGFFGFLGFCLLLFSNYSSVFIASVGFRERKKLAIEAALRCISYVVIFSIVVTALDMPTNVESWSGNKALWFGSIYFGVLALIESRRYFTRASNLILHMINGTFERAPKSKIRYVRGKIKAYALSKNNAQQGPLFIFAGAATAAISAVFLYATFGEVALFAKVAIWLFCLPTLLLGCSIFIGGTGSLFNFWRKGPSLLNLHDQALKQDNLLHVSGLIPRYANQEKRSNFSVHVIQYKVDAIEGEDDIVRVTELLHEKMRDRDLRFRIADEGTRFEVEYSLPPVRKTQKQATERHIWHLQVSMDEEVEQKNDKPKGYSWTVAFPLPLSSR